MNQAVAAFEGAGFSVVCNAPFAGGHITQTYGMPEQGWHCVQIEIDRSLYMDERAVRPRADFTAFVERMSGVIATLINQARHDFSVAAE
jgi:N-formylglutamate deformylase